MRALIEKKKNKQQQQTNKQKLKLKQELSLKKTTRFGGAITVCELPDVLVLHIAAYSEKKRDTEPNCI